MADDIKKNYFTTGQMRNALIQIEDQMVHSNWMPNVVLGINRGGCIPGVYLSHRLKIAHEVLCLLYTSPSPRDRTRSRMPSSA